MGLPSFPLLLISWSGFTTNLSVFSHGLLAVNSEYFVSAVTEANLHCTAAVSRPKCLLIKFFPVASLIALADIFISEIKRTALKLIFLPNTLTF